MSRKEKEKDAVGGSVRLAFLSEPIQAPLISKTPVAA